MTIWLWPNLVKQEIPPAEACLTVLGLAAMAGRYAFLQNVGENKAGKELLKPVDRRVGDAVLGEGQAAAQLPRVLDPDRDGRVNEGPTS